MSLMPLTIGKGCAKAVIFLKKNTISGKPSKRRSRDETRK
jgi:hypothetical protein